MAALRFLYKKTLKRRDLAYDDLIFPKTPLKLPDGGLSIHASAVPND